MIDVFQGFEYVFVSHISFHGNLSVGSIKEYNLRGKTHNFTNEFRILGPPDYVQ